MSLQAEKRLLKKELEKINDEHLINAVRELIKFANQKQEDDILKPFTKKQIIARAKQSEKDIKQGKFISVSTARREMKKW